MAGVVELVAHCVGFRPMRAHRPALQQHQRERECRRQLIGFQRWRSVGFAGLLPHIRIELGFEALLKVDQILGERHAVR